MNRLFPGLSLWAAAGLFAVPAVAQPATPVASAPSQTDAKAVERATALSGIMETLSRYCFAVGEREPKMLPSTFTPGGRIVAEVAHGKPVKPMNSPAEIVDFIMKGRQQQGDVRRHFITNFWIEKLEGNQATVHSYHVIIVSPPGRSETRSTGLYRDEMVRGEDGIWLTRVKQVTLDAPY